MIYTILKRLFDFFGSLIGIMLLSPVFIILTVWILINDFGPVIYKSKRVGKNRELFNFYKFRSMVVNADKMGPSSTSEDDPRITPAGRFLRKYKLDELPQLFNVLMGDMSIVGPRPQVKWAVDQYTEEELKVLTVKPGITDYASLKFHNEGEILAGSADPDKTYMELIHPEKMRLSLEYIKTSSFLIDIKIIFQTVFTIFKK